MKILIAEDDLTSRLFMKKYLSAYGNCSLAANGLGAVELAQEAFQGGEPFDLICLDIMMPKVDGTKALRLIRDMEQTGEGPAAKIIMTTALNDRKTVEQAYAYGCDAYVWKPVEIEQFNKLLKELCLID